jgi:hypothetical protein
MEAMTTAQRGRYQLLYESCLVRPKRKAAADTNFGPQLRAILSGAKPLPAAFEARPAKRLRRRGSDAATRKRIAG